MHNSLACTSCQPSSGVANQQICYSSSDMLYCSLGTCCTVLWGHAVLSFGLDVAVNQPDVAVLVTAAPAKQSTHSSLIMPQAHQQSMSKGGKTIFGFVSNEGKVCQYHACHAIHSVYTLMQEDTQGASCDACTMCCAAQQAVPHWYTTCKQILGCKDLKSPTGQLCCSGSLYTLADAGARMAG